MAPGWRWRRMRRLASRTTVTVGVLLIGVLVLAAVLVRSAAATNIIVNSALDTAADDGECTLREAITAANTNTASGATLGECDAGQASPTVDLITFNIVAAGPHVISTNVLPPITEPVEIDGYTQPGATVNMQAGLAGGTNAIIQIQIDGGGGTDATGLQFDNGSDGSTVRGLAITGYSSEAIRVQVGADGITIQGNFIGMDAPDGLTANPNQDGIVLDARATVGGTSAAQRNLISGNIGSGIWVASGDGTLIQGNLIGTNPAGTADEGNIVGVYVDVDATNVTIGTGTLGNLISGNAFGGIAVDSADTVTIRGNRIGTNGAGTAAVENGGDAILLTDAENVTVGGTGAGEGNLISGNDGVGVDDALGINLDIQGNIIGLNLAGTAAIPNAGPGILLGGTDGATVGGSTSGARNVISGNDFDGIILATFPGATSPIIQGNRIGTSADGMTAIGNGFTGISVNGFAGGTLIGGTGAGEGNLISGNAAPGIDLLDSLGATIQGNIIGLNVDETAALPNGVGGIYTCGCSGPLLIGGTAANAGNVISGNVADGIYLDTVTGAIIQNNRIGTNRAGTAAFGNVGDGIRLEFGASNNAIGGTGPNQANIIAFNGGVGVNILDSGTEDNPIRGNSIHSNGRLGIDLDDDDVTPNDAGDGDTGGNTLQNFPVLTNALLVGGSTQVAGSLASTANGTFAVDVYASPSCDPSGYGEGSSYLGATSVLTDGAGLATFDQPFAAAPAGSMFITTTATSNNGAGNTSEFSACWPLSIATQTPTVTPTITQTPTVTVTGTLPATSTPTPSPTSTPTPTPSPTPTVPALEPSGGDDKGAPGGPNRTREKDKDQQVTEEQRQQGQRTNRYGQDQYRVEGNVKEFRTVDGEPAIILANRDGDVVVILRCGGSCPTVKVGDYVVAEGEKEHEQLFYAESVSVEN